MIVTEQAFLETVLAARERVERLEHVVVIDGEAPEGTISIEELEAMGDRSSTSRPPGARSSPRTCSA